MKVPEWCASDGSHLAAAMPMNVCDRSDPPQLRLHGEIDILTVPALEEALSAMLSDDSGDVVVDLAAVHFIGVAGLEALCHCALDLQRRSHRLIVSSPSALTRRVIDILGLAEYLTLAAGPGGAGDSAAVPRVSRR